MERNRPLMTLCAVTLDCADPASLARFYERATGLQPVDGSHEDFAGLRGPDGFFLGFQRRPPVLPDDVQNGPTVKGNRGAARRLLR